MYLVQIGRCSRALSAAKRINASTTESRGKYPRLIEPAESSSKLTWADTAAFRSLEAALSASAASAATPTFVTRDARYFAEARAHCGNGLGILGLNVPQALDSASLLVSIWRCSEAHRGPFAWG